VGAGASAVGSWVGSGSSVGVNIMVGGVDDWNVQANIKPARTSSTVIIDKRFFLCIVLTSRENPGYLATRWFPWIQTREITRFSLKIKPIIASSLAFFRTRGIFNTGQKALTGLIILAAAILISYK
jgi:hypothetical protein